MASALFRGGVATAAAQAAAAPQALALSAFPHVPPAVRATLTTRGCRVLQAYAPRDDGRRGDPLAAVLSGEFLRHGERDWATLCVFGAGPRAPTRVLVVAERDTAHVAVLPGAWRGYWLQEASATGPGAIAVREDAAECPGVPKSFDHGLLALAAGENGWRYFYYDSATAKWREVCAES